MQLVTTVADFAATLDAHRAAGRRVGLVPTMGALHAGHAALMRRAAAECDVVAVTVFVNPLQFGAGEDFDAYPRTLDTDLEVSERCGAALLFAPTVSEMYPAPVLTTVHVSGLTGHLEGASRPTHFDGVATVVAKLFAIAGRCRAYFGEKDFQQLAVVRRMAADLSMPVEVVGCTTVRETDGLALSSRNAYLDDAERAAATVLYRALRAGDRAIEEGAVDPAAVRAAMAAVVDAEPRAALDYAAAVDPDTLAEPERLAGDVRLLVAARIGATRLIDNIGTTVPTRPLSADDPRKAGTACAGA